MSKETKLKLDELKVQSFITSFTNEQKDFFRGGNDESLDPAGCEDFDDTTGGDGAGSGTLEPPYPTWYLCGTHYCDPLPTNGATCSPNCG